MKAKLISALAIVALCLCAFHYNQNLEPDCLTIADLQMNPDNVCIRPIKD